MISGLLQSYQMINSKWIHIFCWKCSDIGMRHFRTRINYWFFLPKVSLSSISMFRHLCLFQRNSEPKPNHIFIWCSQTYNDIFFWEVFSVMGSVEAKIVFRRSWAWAWPGFFRGNNFSKNIKKFSKNIHKIFKNIQKISQEFKNISKNFRNFF